MLPNTLSTWEAALRNRSSSLFDNYRRFRQRAEAAARGEMEEVGYLADQGRGSRLQQLLARLVPERIGNALTPAELFFLLSASWALDLAWRAPETGQPYEVADPRERYRFLTEWPDRWALSLRQAQVLRRICSSTRVPGRNLSLYTPQHAFVGRDAVNVHLLTALLRLASALDVEYTTHIPEAVREQLSPKQWSAWPQILGASVGLIDSREWIIRVDVTSPTAEQERLLRTEFQAHAQRELDEVRNLLLDSGLAYRRVDLQVNAGLEVPAPTLEVPPSALSKRRHERPFKFLDSFEPEDAPLFFGREDDTVRLLGKVLSHQICVLFGELGVGKTSLLKAGLLPRLEEEGFLPLYARCFDDPTRSIQRVAAQALSQPLGDRGTTLADSLRQVMEQTGQDIVVFLDQSQELFTRLGPETRETFAHDLVECLSLEGERVHFVLSIREDLLSRLYELRQILPTIVTQVYKLERLTPEQAQEAIVRPVAKFQLSFEELLVTRLVEDLNQDGIRPIELQIVCDRLWDTWEIGDRSIRYESYRRLGGAKRILEQMLERQLRRFRWRRYALARTVLREMVTSLQTRTLLRSEEIAANANLEAEVVEEVLAELQEARLVRCLKEEGETRYELRHDYLVERMRDWLRPSAQELRGVHELLRREVNDWQRFGRLLSPETLKQAYRYRRRLQFLPEELELLIRSAAEHQFQMSYWFGRCGELPTDRQVALCTEFLNHPERAVREVIVQAMKRLDRDALLEPLVEALRAADEERRAPILEALAELDTELVQALTSPAEHTRREAAYALGQLGTERAVAPLVETVQQSSEPVREEAVTALAEIDSERGAELLLRHLRTGDEESRWKAAEALGRLGRRRTVRARLERLAARRQASPQAIYALARACLESRRLDEARSLLERLAADPQVSIVPLVQQALNTWEELTRLATQGAFQWALWRKDAAGTAATPGTLSLPLKVRWGYKTKDEVRATPVVGQGTVYIGSYDGNFYALDAETGAPRWTVALDSVIRAAAALSGELVFVPTEQGQLYALEVTTGERQWVRTLASSPLTAPIVEGTRVYVGTTQGRVYALDCARGEIVWQVGLEGAVRGSGAVVGERIYLGTQGGYFFALNAITGETCWHYPVGQAVVSSPAVAEEKVYFGALDGQVYALHTDTGEVRWRASGPGPIHASPAVAEGRVFIGAQDGYLYAFAAATGEHLWRQDLGGALGASPAVAGELVFAGSHGGQLVALEAATGNRRWRHTTGYGIYSSPAIADGRLYLGWAYYNVCAFEPEHRP
ncbi:MAG TPA: hypothetical protein EYP85_17420 [Armatimonadetes bacterium]|nr:hypothetical protein [Armatimonadota bacterium]